MMKRPRILIADAYALVAELCGTLLETEFDVVGIVTDGRALIQGAVKLRPDVILVDIGMPILNGLDAGRQVKALQPAVRLVFLSMNTEITLAAKAFELGASGYLLKTCTAGEMVSAVRQVLSGHSYLSRDVSQHEIDCLRWQRRELAEEDNRLSSRQREVLQLLAEGKGAKEISGILNVTDRTVAFHKFRIKEILGAKNSADLVKYAVRNHMVAV
jgi:DNA-binding NarL/FixJ family response regulator